MQAQEGLNKYLIVAALFFIAIIFLWKGMYINKQEQVLMPKVFPFSVRTLYDADKAITQNIFKDKITVLNIWASWCSSCKKEHNFLLQIKDNPKIQLLGINFNDDEKNAKKFLNDFKNPFKYVLFDEDGNVSINFSLKGLPETFLINKKSEVIFRYPGPLSTVVWEEKFVPLIDKLADD